MITFIEEELKIIKTALNDEILRLRINCIYCESVFKRDTDDCYAPNCPITQSKIEIETLKEKIENILTKQN